MKQLNNNNSNNNNSRYRNFATIIYPESAPADWHEQIINLHVPAFISPLHDKDVTSDNKPKKPHYHVMLIFSGPQRKSSVKKLLDTLGGVGIEVVKDIRGYSRYLCHLDNPDKAQYDVEEVICLSGANYLEIIHLTTDEYSLLADMFNYIVENDVRYYDQFLIYCVSNKPTWAKLILKSQRENIFRFISSYGYRKVKEEEQIRQQQEMTSHRRMIEAYARSEYKRKQTEL